MLYFIGIRAYLRYTEPEEGKSSSFYQNLGGHIFCFLASCEKGFNGFIGIQVYLRYAEPKGGNQTHYLFFSKYPTHPRAKNQQASAKTRQHDRQPISGCIDGRANAHLRYIENREVEIENREVDIEHRGCENHKSDIETLWSIYRISIKQVSNVHQTHIEMRWNIYRTSIGQVSNIYRASSEKAMGHLSNFYQTGIECLSNTYRNPKEHLSNFCLKSTECLSNIYRISMEHQSNFHRTSIECLSGIYRNSMEHLWNFYRTRIGCRSFLSNRYRMPLEHISKS